MITENELKNIIRTNIGVYRYQKNMSETKLASICRDLGAKMSQSKYSRIETDGTTDIFDLMIIAKALKVDLGDLLTSQTNNLGNETMSNIVKDQDFITDPDENEFQYYLDDFTTYFYKSNDPKSGSLITGNISFNKDSSNKVCKTTLRLENDSDEYIGFLFISRPSHSAYCYLCNSFGDVSFLVFSLSYDKLNAWFANVVTVSANNNKRPTTMRMCISRYSGLNDYQKKYLKVHLKQNDNTIIIKPQVLEDLSKDGALPFEIREKIEQILKNSTYKAYEIDERYFEDTSYDMYQQYEYISYIRSKASAVNYNKIPSSVDQFINDVMTNPDSYLK